MMTIDDYLETAGLTAEEFASKVGIAAASLSRIRAGRQNCTRDVMQRIIKASGGAISADSLVHGPCDGCPSPNAPAGKSGDVTAPQLQGAGA